MRIIPTDGLYLDPRREVPRAEAGTIHCCRPDAPYRDDCEPLCRRMPAETEAYRLDLNSTFHGYAVIRIGRYEDEVALGTFTPTAGSPKFNTAGYITLKSFNEAPALSPGGPLNRPQRGSG